MQMKKKIETKFEYIIEYWNIPAQGADSWEIFPNK